MSPVCITVLLSMITSSPKRTPPGNVGAMTATRSTGCKPLAVDSLSLAFAMSFLQSIALLTSCSYKITHVSSSAHASRRSGNFIASEINTRDSYTRVVFERFIFGGCGSTSAVATIGFNVCFVVAGFELLPSSVVAAGCIFASAIFMS